MLYFMKLNIPISVLKEGKTFVVYTPALDLSTCGKTRKEAEERFSEAVEIFFEEIIQKKTLDEVLMGLGWTKAKRQWIAPVVVSNEIKTLDIAHAQ